MLLSFEDTEASKCVAEMVTFQYLETEVSLYVWWFVLVGINRVSGNYSNGCRMLCCMHNTSHNFGCTGAFLLELKFFSTQYIISQNL